MAEQQMTPLRQRVIDDMAIRSMASTTPQLAPGSCRAAGHFAFYGHVVTAWRSRYSGASGAR